MTTSWKEFDTSGYQKYLKTSSRRIILLDYDGTLAPFRDAKERNKAFPYEGISEILSNIMGNKKNRVVIISARPVSEILTLLRLESHPEIWGIYGWERILPNGDYFPPNSQNPEAVSILKTAIKWGQLNHIEWEVKPETEHPVSVAFHWRIESDSLNRTPNQLQELIETYTSKLAQNSSIHLKGGDHVSELIIPGKNKGDAVKAILAETAESDAIAYLGDSAGDEDAFEALGSRGISVLVNSQSQNTAANLHIKPPQELLEFLEFWI